MLFLKSPLGRRHIADGAASHERPEGSRRLLEATCLEDRVEASGCASGINAATGVGKGIRHRFLAKHMRAVLERHAGDAAVRRGDRAVDNDVGVMTVQHRLKVVARFCVVEPELLFPTPGVLHHQVDETDNRHLRVRRQPPQLLAADCAASDKHGFHHPSILH
jgi:hypothetical protein